MYFAPAICALVSGCQTTNVDQAYKSGPVPVEKKSELVPTTPLKPKASSHVKTVHQSANSISIDLIPPHIIPKPDLPSTTVIKESKIAILVPLSGRAPRLGHSLLNAAQMALFESANEDLELLVFDTRGSVEGAVRAAQLAAKEGAQLIIGPLFGPSAEAVRPVAAEANIRVISFSNNQKSAGGGVYVFGFLPEQQVSRVIAYASKNNYQKIAPLIPESPFGDLVLEAAMIAARQHRAFIVNETYYDPSADDLAPLVRKFARYDARKAALKKQKSVLKKKRDEISKNALSRLSGLETLGAPPFEAVLLPVGGADLRRIAPLMAYYDVDPMRIRFLGTASWDEDRGLGIEPALLGAWYAAAPPKSRINFEKNFEAAFGYKPPRLATLGYDGMLLGVALTYGDGGPNYSDEALTDPRGFRGVDGIVRLLSNGSNQRGFAIVEVGERGIDVIDTAPERFEQLGF